MFDRMCLSWVCRTASDLWKQTRVVGGECLD
ncbi:hypothetical protein NOCARDAX2BIS_210064 [Nocardioides sp. AX2bis]|nr:hypothetical protein NOCARDAX2BIS_210064 [Nocardioides sp. AX2bis]